MSAAVAGLALEALVQLIPLVQTLVAQAKDGSVPTAEQEAAVDAALDKAQAAIDAA